MSYLDLIFLLAVLTVPISLVTALTYIMVGAHGGAYMLLLAKLRSSVRDEARHIPGA